MAKMIAIVIVDTGDAHVADLSDVAQKLWDDRYVGEQILSTAREKLGRSSRNLVLSLQALSLHKDDLDNIQDALRLSKDVIEDTVAISEKRKTKSEYRLIPMGELLEEAKKELASKMITLAKVEGL